MPLTVIQFPIEQLWDWKLRAVCNLQGQSAVTAVMILIVLHDKRNH
jgi:hypothetical protein